MGSSLDLKGLLQSVSFGAFRLFILLSAGLRQQRSQTKRLAAEPLSSLVPSAKLLVFLAHKVSNDLHVIIRSVEKLSPKVLGGRSIGRGINKQKLAMLWRKVVAVSCRYVLTESEAERGVF